MLSIGLKINKKNRKKGEISSGSFESYDHIDFKSTSNQLAYQTSALARKLVITFFLLARLDSGEWIRHLSIVS